MSAVQVTTVLGPIDVEDLGMTLMHEHLACDWTTRFVEPADEDARKLYHTPMDASLHWKLAEDPFCCLDAGRLDDPDGIIEELGHFTVAGGRTVVDCTNSQIGRDVRALERISREAGVNVIMGSGWYVHGFHESHKASAGVDELVEDLMSEFVDGADGTSAKPGIIGEIGVSPQFTDAEKVRLRAASRVQREVGVPLMIHLPGWKRRAPEVLDIVLGEGVAPEAVVLCHMDPSGDDAEYQRSVAELGVWLEFDMIGMPFYYAGEGQSPAPEQTASAVARLIADGHGERLLLSHDMASKGMWTRHGGNGIGYVPQMFLPRLERHGVSAEQAATLLTENPAALFALSAASADGGAADVRGRSTWVRGDQRAVPGRRPPVGDTVVDAR
ncbi:phosphotriesterase [Gordonia sp. zg691]|uniref:Phosphotriesterase n=1 Tax=Gordonia jinghuaiqii TaxID=2758710 RepID=A0A7D7LRT9_9ACTN|nr:phosphotriesterase [Gordonia jinghuaiqii]MBD0862932.1 phosphotriesterase [Gordonia jinghuaiqii]MCR5978943.1 phosphotriesterase [Gordonia jinghuaiqii]QMT01720.1 phosphotriesterase [Gordonia jinghuaiqii]